jgi:hypothetical protein
VQQNVVQQKDNVLQQWPAGPVAVKPLSSCRSLPQPAAGCRLLKNAA